MDHFNDRLAGKRDPTFFSSIKFVEREKGSTSSQFAVQLMADEKTERGLKSGGGGNNIGYLLIKVKRLRHSLKVIVMMIMLSNFKMITQRPKGSERSLAPGNRNTCSARVPPQCFVCHMDRCECRYGVVDCRKFRKMLSSKRKDSVSEARRCFNCLGNHVVKDCGKGYDCHWYQTSDVGEHFSCYVIVLFLLSLRALGQLCALIGIGMESEIRRWPTTPLFRCAAEKLVLLTS